MSGDVIAMPGVEMVPAFVLDTSDETQVAAWLAGRQSVLDEIAEALPWLRQRGFKPSAVRLAEAS